MSNSAARAAPNTRVQDQRRQKAVNHCGISPHRLSEHRGPQSRNGVAGLLSPLDKRIGQQIGGAVLMPPSNTTIFTASLPTSSELPVK